MLRIGLTGGIGAGKSTVAQQWRDEGVPVIDLDALSRAVLDEPGDGLDETVERFGTDYLLPTGTIDRPRLAALVFADARARADLEGIVLGRVDAEVRELESALSAEGAELVVHDSPLLLEKRRDGDFAVVVGVIARREDRIDRVVRSRGRPRDHVESVMAAQVSDLERYRRCDRLILNTGDRAELVDRSRRALEVARGDQS